MEIYTGFDEIKPKLKVYEKKSGKLIYDGEGKILNGVFYPDSPIPTIKGEDYVFDFLEDVKPNVVITNYG